MAMLEERSRTWIGNEYLYVEPPVISPVRVEAASVSRHGMLLTLRMLPVPGFVHPRNGEVARVSTGLEDTAITEQSITQLNIPWTLYTDTELVPRMSRIAAGQGALVRSNHPEACRRFARLARALAEALGDERGEGAAATATRRLESQDL